MAAMQAQRSNQTEPIIYVLGRFFLVFRDVIGRVARSIPPKSVDNRTVPISGETLAFKRQNWTAVISSAANWPFLNARPSREHNLAVYFFAIVLGEA